MIKYNIIAFILLTIIGTISHEFGHYIAALLLGFDPTIHFSYVTYFPSTDDLNLNISHPEDINAITILLAGPLSTIIIGLIGSCAIKPQRPKDFLHITLFYLSLFWLRFPFNLAISVFKKITFNTASFFGGDELLLSSAFGLYPGTFSLILGLVGLFFVFRSILIFVDNRNMFNFLITGFTGGLIGYVIWFVYVGPLLLP